MESKKMEKWLSNNINPCWPKMIPWLGKQKFVIFALLGQNKINGKAQVKYNVVTCKTDYFTFLIDIM